MNPLRLTQTLFALSAAAIVAGAVPASAMQRGNQASEEVFVDLGRWVIVQDEAARACELRLTSDPQVVLRYRLQDGRAGVLILQRKSGRFFTGMVGDVEWAFDSARYTGYQGGNGYSLSAGARDIEAGFRSAKTLSVVHGGLQVARISLKTSSAGFRLLKQCSEQWRYIPWYRRLANARYRDLDTPVAEPSAAPTPVESLALTTPLKPRPINPAAWISNEDALPWPKRGFRSGRGVLRYTLLVDEKGRAKDCEVERSTGSRRFDNSVCRVLEERARFEPARGSDGQAVEARYSSSVRFAQE